MKVAFPTLCILTLSLFSAIAFAGGGGGHSDPEPCADVALQTFYRCDFERVEKVDRRSVRREPIIQNALALLTSPGATYEVQGCTANGRTYEVSLKIDGNGKSVNLGSAGYLGWSFFERQGWGIGDNRPLLESLQVSVKNGSAVLTKSEAVVGPFGTEDSVVAVLNCK
jgi:hypothetical protein